MTRLKRSAQGNSCDGEKRQWQRFAAVVLLVTAAALVWTVTSLLRETQDENEISLASLSSFISLGTSYLVRISHTATQDPNFPGKFTYIANLQGKLQTEFRSDEEDDYNLLRHNGAIYSLGLSYQRENNAMVVDVMKRAVGYLKDVAIGPLPQEPNLLAPWEPYKPNGKEHVKSKLGGAGLALIALVSLEYIAPGTTDLEYLRKLGEFIHFLQHDDGSFICRYSSRHGKDDSWQSLYYPGEAALGLVYLASIETDEGSKTRWLNVATKALLYLEKLRRTQDLSEIEPDHWALLATSQLLPLLDQDSVEYWLVYEHAVRVVQSMLADHTANELTEHRGCFTMDRRTCPTATRLEGLLAALSFIRETEIFVGEREHVAEPLRERMLHDVKAGIAFLLGSQETDDAYNMQGGVPEKYPPSKQNDREVRVDYVQHSMSAVIAYENLVLNERYHHGRLRNAHFKENGSLLQGYGLLGLTVLVLGAAGVMIAVYNKPKKRLRHVV